VEHQKEAADVQIS